MKPIDLGTMWMLGVIAIMATYALIAMYGVNKNSKK